MEQQRNKTKAVEGLVFLLLGSEFGCVCLGFIWGQGWDVTPPATLGLLTSGLCLAWGLWCVGISGRNIHNYRQRSEE